MTHNAKIFQICYSPEIRAQLDPGFDVTGDETNPRPDWFEYWHIRQFLLSTQLEPSTFYGFFSPKFKEKTNLVASDVHNFIDKHGDKDVISFSPYLDQSALFLNIVEQADYAHRNSASVFSDICQRHFKGEDPELVINSSSETIFCNFFVAKPAFWRRWLEICEDIFELVETNQDPLGVKISGKINYKESAVPLQTFIIERIATLILSLEKQWTSANHPSYQMARGKAPIAQATTLLLALDALKQSYQRTQAKEYLYSYFEQRLSLFHNITPSELRASPAPTSSLGIIQTKTQNAVDKMRAKHLL